VHALIFFFWEFHHLDFFEKAYKMICSTMAVLL